MSALDQLREGASKKGENLRKLKIKNKNEKGKRVVGN
jgi:hypothetical protein